MIEITVDDVTYTFSNHAEGRLRKHGIRVSAVEAVLLDPDNSVPSDTSGAIVYSKTLLGEKYALAVVVDEDSRKIVTTYWQTPFK